MAGDRSENTDVFNAEPACKYEDIISFCCDNPVVVHSRFLLPDRCAVMIINALTGRPVPALSLLSRFFRTDAGVPADLLHDLWMSISDLKNIPVPACGDWARDSIQ